MTRLLDRRHRGLRGAAGKAQSSLDVLGVAQEQLDVVVDRAPIVLAHVMRRLAVARDRFAKRRLVVRLQGSGDHASAFGVERCPLVSELRLPMLEDPLDGPGVPLLRDRGILDPFLDP